MGVLSKIPSVYVMLGCPIKSIKSIQHKRLDPTLTPSPPELGGG